MPYGGLCELGRRLNVQMDANGRERKWMGDAKLRNKVMLITYADSLGQNLKELKQALAD